MVTQHYVHGIKVSRDFYKKYQKYKKGATAEQRADDIKFRRHLRSAGAKAKEIPVVEADYNVIVQQGTTTLDIAKAMDEAVGRVQYAKNVKDAEKIIEQNQQVLKENYNTSRREIGSYIAQLEKAKTGLNDKSRYVYNNKEYSGYTLKQMFNKEIDKAQADKQELSTKFAEAKTMVATQVQNLAKAKQSLKDLKGWEKKAGKYVVAGVTLPKGEFKEAKSKAQTQAQVGREYPATEILHQKLRGLGVDETGAGYMTGALGLIDIAQLSKFSVETTDKGGYKIDLPFSKMKRERFARTMMPRTPARVGGEWAGILASIGISANLEHIVPKPTTTTLSSVDIFPAQKYTINGKQYITGYKGSKMLTKIGRSGMVETESAGRFGVKVLGKVDDVTYAYGKELGAILGQQADDVTFYSYKGLTGQFDKSGESIGNIYIKGGDMLRSWTKAMKVASPSKQYEAFTSLGKTGQIKGADIIGERTISATRVWQPEAVKGFIKQIKSTPKMNIFIDVDKGVATQTKTILSSKGISNLFSAQPQAQLHQAKVSAEVSKIVGNIGTLGTATSTTATIPPILKSISKQDVSIQTKPLDLQADAVKLVSLQKPKQKTKQKLGTKLTSLSSIGSLQTPAQRSFNIQLPKTLQSTIPAQKQVPMQMQELKTESLVMSKTSSALLPSTSTPIKPMLPFPPIIPFPSTSEKREKYVKEKRKKKRYEKGRSLLLPKADWLSVQRVQSKGQLALHPKKAQTKSWFKKVKERPFFWKFKAKGVRL